MGACPRRHWLSLPLWCLKGGLPSLSPAAPALSLIFCPYPPDPLPPRGRGRFLVYFAGGSAPGTPALARLRHLQSLPNRCPTAEIRDSPQNRKNRLFYWQSRQPRRGGTGGEELRRLRWSSPPGQSEQVPRGFNRPAGHHSGRDSQCRAGSVAGMQGGVPPAAKKNSACRQKIRQKALTFRRRRRIMS